MNRRDFSKALEIVAYWKDIDPECYCDSATPIGGCFYHDMKTLEKFLISLHNAEETEPQKKGKHNVIRHSKSVRRGHG